MKRGLAIALVILLLLSLGMFSGKAAAATTQKYWIRAVVVDGSGTGLANVRVEISNTTTNTTTGTSTTTTYIGHTNSTGKFTSQLLAQANYTVEATATGYSANTSYIVDISSANVTIYFTMIQLEGNISGFVTTGTIPVANATVTLSNENISFMTSSSAPLGEYTINGLPSGFYNITAAKAGYVGYRGTVNITAGNTTHYDLTLRPTLGQLIGVVDVTSQSGKLIGLSGANVTLQGTNSTYRTTTNAQGIYYFNNITQGTYTVSVLASGYTPGQGTVVITLAKTSYLNFTLPQLTRSSPFTIPGFIGGFDLDHSMVIVALLIVIVAVSGTMTLLNRTYNWKEPRRPDKSEEDSEEKKE